MATKKDVGHKSVSNQGQESEATKKLEVFKEPKEGINPKTSKVNPDGSEAVAGHKMHELASLEMEISPIEIESLENLENLRDIGEASFGILHEAERKVLETVHDEDNRVRITNTSNYPWRVHASLLITAADNSIWVGTGWFIGPHTLMTAGHCVYIKNSGVPGRDGWVKSIKVMPGRNGSTLPYGSVTSTNFRTVTSWTSSGDQNYDYGAIIIPTELGNRTGWFGFGVYSDSDLKSCTGNISGYPADKPSGQQWYDSHKIASVNSKKVYYDIDTYGGQSGSAVYRIKNGKRYGIAIHAYGGGSTNSGTRIIKAIYDNMVSWKA